jgi:lipid II isoglutaminyl synthase (glutamine-hydrolysing)
LLSKNPAGWAELLEILGPSSLPVVIGINARIADGHDPSWLWDVEFEQLAGRDVVATGERCLDLAVRLKYAGIRHRVVSDQRRALSAAAARAVEYVGNYTAFQQLRRSIGGPSRAAAVETKWSGARPVPKAHRSALTSDSTLRVVVVHPDLLGTYGDGGNGKILAGRAAWRGWPVELVLARSGAPLPTGDIYCLGGGEDAPQVESAELLSMSVISSAVENGAAVLAVCAGFQIVGRSFPDADGLDHEGLGLLDVVTRRGTGPRSVGEVVADPISPVSGPVELTRYTGFENHSGVTLLGQSTEALGRVVVGVGNGDESRTDGAVSGRVVGTYLHGPVLARNPAIADALLSLATRRTLEPLDDTEEEALRSERLEAVVGRHRPGGQRKTLQLAGRIRHRST